MKHNKAPKGSTTEKPMKGTKIGTRIIGSGGRLTWKPSKHAKARTEPPKVDK